MDPERWSSIQSFPFHIPIRLLVFLSLRPCQMEAREYGVWDPEWIAPRAADGAESVQGCRCTNIPTGRVMRDLSTARCGGISTRALSFPSPT